MKARLTAILASGVVVMASIAASAQAHGPNSPPKFGGIVVQHLDVQYEVVARPDRVAIYIEDHKKPVDTSHASGKLILSSAGVERALPLAPGAFNELQVAGNFDIGAGAKATVDIAVPGKQPASFTLTLAP